jgi:hypothetical protein
VNRLPLLAAAALLAASCSEGVRAGEVTAEATRTYSGRMIPGSCAEASYGTIGSTAETAHAKAPRTVGIVLNRGAARYVVDTLRVEVLPPGSGIPTSADATARHDDAVRRLERTGLAAADAQYALTFDGKDEAGARLPAGSYPVVFSLTTHARPGSGCDGPPAGFSGLITTIDWAG